MKIYPLYLLLLWQLTLSAQPTLTVDYYLQDGLHQYNWFKIDSTTIENNGENILWDFSKGQYLNPATSYQLDTLSHYFYTNHPNLSLADRRLIKGLSDFSEYEYLNFTESINRVAIGQAGYTDWAEVNGLYQDPVLVFPSNLEYGETIQDSFTNPKNNNQIDTLPVDTIQNKISFTYIAHGQLIHPNRDTFFEVIKLKVVIETHIGNRAERYIWYSKAAKGILAETKNHFWLNPQKGFQRICIKNMPQVNLSDDITHLDTILVNHSLRDCSIQLFLFSNDSATISPEYDLVLIDYFNNGTIEDTSFSAQPVSHQASFDIGIHRLIYKETATNLSIEKIVWIKDIRAPSIYRPNFPGYSTLNIQNNGAYLTPDNLFFGVEDNSCSQNFEYHFWFPETGLPHPDSLTIEEIETTLPTTYFFECIPNSYERHIYGIVYVFDEAQNWTYTPITLVINSRNCSPDCLINQEVQLSIQDIDGLPIPDIQNNGLKKLAYHNKNYQLRICENDALNQSFQLSLFQENKIITKGVSTFDLLQIRKHILGNQPFTNFQQFAAADVNASGTITAFDLFLIKEVILGRQSLFPNAVDWVFFEKEEGLLNKQPYVDVLPIHLLEEKRFAIKDTTYHFLGIKLGDVSRF